MINRKSFIRAIGVTTAMATLALGIAAPAVALSLIHISEPTRLL